MQKPYLIAGLSLLLILLAFATGIWVVHSNAASNANTNILHVTRTEPLPGYNYPPLDVTIRNAQSVQRVYAAMYALKRTQPGIYFCPFDNGLTYHLTFLYNTTVVRKINFDPAGCSFIIVGQTLHGGNDMRYADYAFQKLLAQTIGIPSLIPQS